MEKKIKGKTVFEGKIINVVVDDILIDDSQASSREVVIHNGGACMALKQNNDEYLMVRQYRYAQGVEMLEFPAGRLEINEDPQDAITREIKEETGYSAKDINYLGKIVPTGGYLTEVIHLYHGIVDEYVGQNLDSDERITVESYPLEKIIEMIMSNEIIDAKTIVLAFKIHANK